MGKITIKQKAYPILFGTATFYDFAEETGIDVFKLMNTFEHNLLIKMFHIALQNGHLEAKRVYEKEIKDTMKLIDSEPGVFKRLLQMFTKAAQELAGIDDEKEENEGKNKAQEKD